MTAAIAALVGLVVGAACMFGATALLGNSADSCRTAADSLARASGAWRDATVDGTVAVTSEKTLGEIRAADGRAIMAYTDCLLAG